MSYKNVRQVISSIGSNPTAADAKALAEAIDYPVDAEDPYLPWVMDAYELIDGVATARALEDDGLSLYGLIKLANARNGIHLRDEDWAQFETVEELLTAFHGPLEESYRRPGANVVPPAPARQSAGAEEGFGIMAHALRDLRL